MLKKVFLYILALVVLLSPAILLGWMGWTLLEWPGMIIGVILGLAIFVFSMRKLEQQEALGDETAQLVATPEEAVKRD